MRFWHNFDNRKLIEICTDGENAGNSPIHRQHIHIHSLRIVFVFCAKSVTSKDYQIITLLLYVVKKNKNSLVLLYKVCDKNVKILLFEFFKINF